MESNSFIERLGAFIKKKAEEETLEKYTFMKAAGGKLTDREYDLFKAAYAQGMADGLAIDLEEIDEKLK
jgi:hypothetical protein